MDMAVERGLLEKSGAWFKYDGESIGQGKAGAVKYLEKNKDIANLLESILREGLTTTP